MKTNIFISVFYLVLLSFTPVSKYSKLTRNGAIDMVMKTIINNTNKTNIFCSNELIKTDLYLIDNQEILNPYKASWVFFIDDHPFSSWYHESRIIFVNANNGKFVVSKAEIYPKELHSRYEQILSVVNPQPVAKNSVSYSADPLRVISKSNYALIIVSFDDMRNWFNTSLIYNVLVQSYNYQKNNIIVLYGWDGNSKLYLNDLDGGNPSNDIDGPATFENIMNTINDFSGLENNFPEVPKLGHDDQLAIFITGVPVPLNITGVEPSMVFPLDEINFATYPISGLSLPMEKIDCGQMIFNLDVNSSAAINNYFKAAHSTQVICKNRYLTGPTILGEKSQAEMYITSGRYSEYLYYWASAARGYLPEATKPWNILATIGKENGGGFPYSNYIPGHPGDTYLDDNRDHFLQMAEAFNYANNLDTWSDDGYCYLPYQGNEKETPNQTNEIPFVEDLITVAGLSGHITTPSQSLPARSYIIADSLILDADKILRFADKTELYIHRNKITGGKSNARLIAKVNSKLILGQNMIVANLKEVSTSWPLSTLLIYSDSIIIGSNTSFKNVNIGTISNPRIKSFILKNITMINGMINTPNCDKVIIHKNNFTNTFLRCLNIGNALIDSNQFINSHTFFNGFSGPSKLDLVANKYKGNCLIYSSNGGTVLVQNFQNYCINGNEILNTLYGIKVEFSGWGNANSILSNTIGNKAGINRQVYGMCLYYTRAVLHDNYISDINGNGLELYNFSMVSIEGNKEARSVNETQRIIDNVGWEVFSDKNSFPVPFKWNAIIDEDNLTINDYLLYGDIASGEKKDISLNYWGRNFSPKYDLYPVESYKWEPVFNLRDSDSPVASSTESMFTLAQAKFYRGDYIGAKTDFKNIIRLFPTTQYASASLKELFVIEKNTTNDFNQLKNYYKTDRTIISHQNLAQVADFMANKCDIALMNWAKAIDWYEKKIKDPPSINDSIYAIIDVGNLYIQMRKAGVNSTLYKCSMPNLVPESDSAHLANSNYLIWLLKGRNIRTK
jgi:hypothetical protein